MLNLIKEMLAAGFSQPSNPYGFGEERHSDMGGLVSISSTSGALAEVSPWHRHGCLTESLQSLVNKPAPPRQLGLPGSAGGACSPWQEVDVLGSPQPAPLASCRALLAVLSDCCGA